MTQRSLGTTRAPLAELMGDEVSDRDVTQCESKKLTLTSRESSGAYYK